MHDILNAEVRTPMLELTLFLCQGSHLRFHGDLRRFHALRSLRDGSGNLLRAAAPSEILQRNDSQKKNSQ